MEKRKAVRVWDWNANCIACLIFSRNIKNIFLHRKCLQWYEKLGIGNICPLNHHYNVTRATRPKWPSTRHLVQQLVQANNKETAKLRFARPSRGDSTSDRWNGHKRPAMRKVFLCHDVLQDYISQNGPRDLAKSRGTLSVNIIMNFVQSVACNCPAGAPSRAVRYM